MYVYDKRQRLQKHYAGGGIFDTIRNVVSKIASNSSVRELGKKAIAKAGNAAGEKIVNAIKNKRKQKLNTKNRVVLNTLSQPLNRQKILRTLSQPLNDTQRPKILRTLSQGQSPIANILEGIKTLFYYNKWTL